MDYHKRYMETRTLKIDWKKYIRDVLEGKEIASCHTTVLPIKAGLFISMDQINDDKLTHLAVYQRLVEKFMY